MLKFIWGKGHQPTAERVKLQKELFGFSKVSIVLIGGGGYVECWTKKIQTPANI